MEWYYAVEDQQRGPVGDRELAQLVADEVVTEDTLVWNSTFDEWQAFADVRDTVPWSILATATVPEAPDRDAGGCSACGRATAPEGLTEIGGERLCSDCRLSRLHPGPD